MANTGGGQSREVLWTEEFVRRFGAAAKEVRGKRSAQWLSDRTAELGQRISPTVIAKLDSGHRGNVLHIWEVVLIAQALNVPPVALIYPDLIDGPVEIVPGAEVPTNDAIQWFTGERPMMLGGDLEKMDREELRSARAAIEELRSNAAGLGVMRELRAAQKARDEAMERLSFAVERSKKGYTEGLDTRRDIAKDAEARVEAALALVRERGLRFDGESGGGDE